MKRIPLYQVDAFTDQLFRGNPAAVCPLTEWLPDQLMQQIAAENNLAETAFFVPFDSGYKIRWFTPAVEVDLCGHATLATAFVLFYCLNYNSDSIKFFSDRSGELKVTHKEGLLNLDFPSDKIQHENIEDDIFSCLGVSPQVVFRGKSDFMAVFENEKQIISLLPDFSKIAALKARGLIVTAPGTEVDFVSRFFAPQSGIDEDPVTGSAHTTLIPYWSKRLGKTEMTAMQLSKRGGKLICSYRGERCLIGGKAVLYLNGEIQIDA